MHRQLQVASSLGLLVGRQDGSLYTISRPDFIPRQNIWVNTNSVNPETSRITQEKSLQCVLLVLGVNREKLEYLNRHTQTEPATRAFFRRTG